MRQEAWSAQSLEATLSDSGYGVMTVQLHQAVEAVGWHRPALVVAYLAGCRPVDLDLLRALHAHSRTPIIAVGFSDDATCRLVAFEAGVDDYVAHPFNPLELVARVRAILRRTSPAMCSVGLPQALPLPA